MNSEHSVRQEQLVLNQENGFDGNFVTVGHFIHSVGCECDNQFRL